MSIILKTSFYTSLCAITGPSPASLCLSVLLAHRGSRQGAGEHLRFSLCSASCERTDLEWQHLSWGCSCWAACNCTREVFGLTLAFWVNLEEGGDVLLLFSLTCLPVGSVSLDVCWDCSHSSWAGKESTHRAFCFPITRILLILANLVCAEPSRRAGWLLSPSYLTLLLSEAGRKLPHIIPFWDVLVSAAWEDPFSPSPANPNP